MVPGVWGRGRAPGTGELRWCGRRARGAAQAARTQKRTDVERGDEICRRGACCGHGERGRLDSTRHDGGIEGLPRGERRDVGHARALSSRENSPLQVPVEQQCTALVASWTAGNILRATGRGTLLALGATACSRASPWRGLEGGLPFPPGRPSLGLPVWERVGRGRGGRRRGRRDRRRGRRSRRGPRPRRRPPARVPPPRRDSGPTPDPQPPPLPLLLGHRLERRGARSHRPDPLGLSFRKPRPRRGMDP